MPDIKELFKHFVFGYIADGHTQTIEAEAELKRLIAEWVDSLNPKDCFTFFAMYDVLDYVEHNITDKNKGFYGYELNDYRYACQLEKCIRYIIKSFNKNA